MNTWAPIEELEITSNINSIHIDTRDFHCLLSEEERTSAIKGQKYIIPINEIKIWLLDLERITGGKGEWRMLKFKNIDTNGWLKYIRLYRNDEETFIVCDRESHSIDWKGMTESNLEKEYLNFIK